VKRIPIILFLLAAGCGARPDTMAHQDLPAVKSQAEYDSEYRQAYLDAPQAEKARMIRRVVDLEIEAGQQEEAKAWIRRGLDDKRDVVYTDAPAKELLAEVVKERADAKAAALTAEAATKEQKEREAREALIAERKANSAHAEAVRAETKRLEAEAAKAAKAANETNENGLVLLDDTVKSEDGSITGIVENRRGHTVKYAQISFNLYDADHAQIGSAFANINGLEAGGKWHFKAYKFGVRSAYYKFSALSGF
jgi:hypothetical protein